jgi:DnaJ domain
VLAAHALEVLSLKPGATTTEIKEAYRDLVKVWHPDRFGNDVRLRQKAEHQLKLINEAYRTLQSNPGVNGMYGAATASRAGSYQSSECATAAPRSRHYRSSRNWPGVGWIFGGVGIFALLLAGYFAKHDATIPSRQTQEIAPAAQVVPSAGSAGAEARPRRAVHPKDPRLARFSVRSLSEAETDKLQMVCSRQMQLRGQAAYQECVRAQLAMLTHPTSPPDLSALNDAERASLESVCVEAKRRGPDRYNRCRAEQVASLAAEPARPDLSTSSDADRQAIESACSNAKDREGPAGYDRCLERFIQALATAK